MTQPGLKRRDPLRLAIPALSVALVAIAALVAFLVWGRSTPTLTPSPSPTLSASAPSATATGSPSPTATPSPTPSSEGSAPQSSPVASTKPPVSPPTTTSPTPTTSDAQTMMWEGKAAFEHFTVEVLQDDPNQDDEMVEGKAAFLVEVCVTTSLDGSDDARVSTDPWTLEDSDDNVQTPQQGGHQPAFPTDAEYAVGTCARGYLTFDFVSVNSDYAILVYDNGLGDRAVWQFH